VTKQLPTSKPSSSDEAMKEKAKGTTKSTRGSSASRLGNEAAPPAKGSFSDEAMKDKAKGTIKSTRGSSASRLGNEAAPPAKGSFSDEAVKEKSFFKRLFGGKSSPEGHSEKAAASSSKSAPAPNIGSSKGLSDSNDKPKDDKPVDEKNPDKDKKP